MLFPLCSAIFFTPAKRKKAERSMIKKKKERVNIPGFPATLRENVHSKAGFSLSRHDTFFQPARGRRGPEVENCRFSICTVN